MINRHVALIVTSLLSIVLFTVHWADEVARGLEPGTIGAAGGFAILAVWLGATLAFNERRWGIALMLLFGLLSAGVPVLHMLGRGLVLGRYANSDAMFFWVWTNFALGAAGMSSAILAAQLLWRGRGRRQ